MGLYQYKDFLTLDDVGYFLLNKGLLPPVPIEQLYLSDLRPFIINMIQSDKITPVFEYDGYIIIIDRSIYEYEVDTYKGMMRASYTMIQDWKKGKTPYYKPFKGKFDPFHDTFVNERYRKYIDDGKQIILYAQNNDDDTTEVCLQYPKEQLEAIFDRPINNANKLQERISELETENAQLKATTNNENGQGDSLLILGAVMTCLDTTTIRNYTQQVLINNILDKYQNISGISESTLTKKFAESKKYLNQKK